MAELADFVLDNATFLLTHGRGAAVELIAFEDPVDGQGDGTVSRRSRKAAWTSYQFMPRFRQATISASMPSGSRRSRHFGPRRCGNKSASAPPLRR